MSAPRARPLRCVARLAMFGAAASLIITAGVAACLAWQYAYHFTYVGCLGEHPSLAEQGFASEAVILETPRGYALRGWLAAGSRAADSAIIVLPGASGDTQLALPDAALLAQAGYTTLIYEHRACADPRQLHSGGYLEAQDLVSAAQYLHARADVHHLGVLGFSAGGTAALLAAAQEPALEAVVAEGGFASLEADTLPPSTADPFTWATRWLTLQFVGWQLGAAPDTISPVAHVAQISPRPLLLIYGEYEARHGQALYAAAGAPKALWIVPAPGTAATKRHSPPNIRRASSASSTTPLARRRKRPGSLQGDRK